MRVGISSIRRYFIEREEISIIQRGITIRWTRQSDGGAINEELDVIKNK